MSKRVRDFDAEDRLASSIPSTNGVLDIYLNEICGWIKDREETEKDTKEGKKFKTNPQIFVLNNVKVFVEKVKQSKDHPFTHLVEGDGIWVPVVKSVQDKTNPKKFYNELTQERSNVLLEDGKTISFSMPALKNFTPYPNQYVKILGLRCEMGTTKEDGTFNYWLKASNLGSLESNPNDLPTPIGLPQKTMNSMGYEFTNMSKVVDDWNATHPIHTQLKKAYDITTVYVPSRNIRMRNETLKLDDFKGDRPDKWIPNLSTVMDAYCNKNKEEFWILYRDRKLFEPSDSHPTLKILSLITEPKEDSGKQPVPILKMEMSMTTTDKIGCDHIFTAQQVICWSNGLIEKALCGAPYFNYCRDQNKHQAVSRLCHPDVVLTVKATEKKDKDEKKEKKPSKQPAIVTQEVKDKYNESSYTYLMAEGTIYPSVNFISLIDSLGVPLSKEFTCDFVVDMENDLRIMEHGGRLDQEGLLSGLKRKKDVLSILINTHPDRLDLNPLNKTSVKPLVNLSEADYMVESTVRRYDVEVAIIPAYYGQYGWEAIEDLAKIPLIGEKSYCEIIADSRRRKLSKEVLEYQGDILFASSFLSRFWENKKGFYTKNCQLSHTERRKQYMKILDDYFKERRNKIGKDLVPEYRFEDRSDLFKVLGFVPYSYRVEEPEKEKKPTTPEKMDVQPIVDGPKKEEVTITSAFPLEETEPVEKQAPKKKKKPQTHQ